MRKTGGMYQKESIFYIFKTWKAGDVSNKTADGGS